MSDDEEEYFRPEQALRVKALHEARTLVERRAPLGAAFVNAIDLVTVARYIETGAHPFDAEEDDDDDDDVRLADPGDADEPHIAWPMHDD